VDKDILEPSIGSILVASRLSHMPAGLDKVIDEFRFSFFFLTFVDRLGFVVIPLSRPHVDINTFESMLAVRSPVRSWVALSEWLLRDVFGTRLHCEMVLCILLQ